MALMNCLTPQNLISFIAIVIHCRGNINYLNGSNNIYEPQLLGNIAMLIACIWTDDVDAGNQIKKDSRSQTAVQSDVAVHRQSTGGSIGGGPPANVRWTLLGAQARQAMAAAGHRRYQTMPTVTVNYHQTAAAGGKLSPPDVWAGGRGGSSRSLWGGGGGASLGGGGLTYTHFQVSPQIWATLF